MLTQTRIAFPVSRETITASSHVRCQRMRQGEFQSSTVGAGHICSRLTPGIWASASGETIATSDETRRAGRVRRRVMESTLDGGSAHATSVYSIHRVTGAPV